MTDIDIIQGMWGQLSTFELLEMHGQRMEMIRESLDMIFTLLTIYISIITAYLFVAYTVGKTLTRSQIFIATVAYLFGASSMVLGMVVLGDLINQYLILNAYYWEFVGADGLAAESRQEAATSAADVLNYLLLVVGTIAPLYFMWDVRRSKA